MSGVYTAIVEKDKDGRFVGRAPTSPARHTQAGSIS